MVYIIVKGKNQASSSRHFRPHFNEATGKYHGDKKDYLDTVKAMNLVPYEKPKEKKEPEYKPSEWAHSMVREIKRTDGKPGGAFYKQLEKKGYGPKRLASAKKQYDKHFKGEVK